jgi:hypothetical protein
LLQGGGKLLGRDQPSINEVITEANRAHDARREGRARAAGP